MWNIIANTLYIATAIIYGEEIQIVKILAVALQLAAKSIVMYFIIAILLFYNYHSITISGNLHMGLAFESGPITLVALINFLLNTKTAASSTCDMVLTETAL